MSAANERALDATLKTSLVNEDPFLYAHLIKFERAIGTDGSRPSKNGRDYVYLTDASRDIAFDDGSTNVAGVANGVQTYRANRVASVGTISETTEAKASSLSLEINSTLLGATSPEGAGITITYAGTSIGSTVTIAISSGSPGWKESGFLIGDKVCIKRSGHAFHNNRAVITSFSADELTITCEAIDAGSTTSATTNTAFVVQNIADEYESLFYEEFEGTTENGAYAGYINREVFIYKVHINPDTGAIIEASSNSGPYLIFKGIIAKAKITEDPNRSSKVTWSLTSHWGDFIRVNGRVTSDPEHRALGADGQIDTGALVRYEYGSDLGFMHSERSLNLIAVYKAKETKTRLRKSGWIIKRYKQEEYTVMVDRDVDLRFNLDAKYLPVIYGVQRTDSIPIFADTLKTNSAEVYVAYAICEGEIAGLYDIYIDDQGRVCTDDIDNDARSGSSDTVDVVCVGRMDRGDTLPSAPANSIGDAIQSYVENMGDATGAAVGIVPNNFFNDILALNTEGVDSGVNSATGVLHEHKTTLERPIDATIIFHAGRPHQRADDLLVRTAKQGLAVGTNTTQATTNQGFKLQEGSDNKDNYWGPQHRLLDTAYVVVKYTVSDGETEIPSLDFVVRGREIEQYNYDFSYEQHPNPVYSQTGSSRTADTQAAYFNTGDLVDSYDPNNSNAALVADITIMEKSTYVNSRNENVIKFRFDKDPTGGKKEFHIVKDGIAGTSDDKLTLATWDYINATGTISGFISENIGTGANDAVLSDNSGGDGGKDILIPAGTMRDVLIQNATNGAVQIALLDTNETPANISLEEGRSFYQVSFNTSTNKIENLLNNNSADVWANAKKIVIANAAKLDDNAAGGSNSYDDHYQNQEIELTRALSDNSIVSQTVKVIKYHGTHKVALFGDFATAAATIGTDYITANGSSNSLIPESISNTVVTYASATNVTDLINAIQAELDAGRDVLLANSVALRTHPIPQGTKVVSTNASSRTITYNNSLINEFTNAPLLDTRFPVFHRKAGTTAEVFQPAAGKFIPDSPDDYSVVSRGDKKVSINPAIQLLDYLTNDRYGRGLDKDNDINLDTFKQAARDCDTRSDVTIQAASGQGTFVVGDKYEYKPTLNDGSTKLFWRGTIKSIETVVSWNNITYSQITFTDCIGKLITKFENWRTLEEGQLLHKRHTLTVSGNESDVFVVHKIPNGVTGPLTDASLGRTTHTLGGDVPLTKFSGTGPSTLTASAAGGQATVNNASADGNPVIKKHDGTLGTFKDGGYSLYDSDDVKYWRYIGWQEHKQSEVTRHQTNALVRTEAPVFDNVNSMLKHFNGILRYVNGKYELVVEQALDETSFSTDDIRKIDEGDIIGAISLDDAGVKGSANSVSVAVPDPSIRYDDRSVTFFNSDYLKQDRGIPKKKDIKTPLISNYFNARMNAEQYLIQSRSNKKINFKIGPKGVLLLAGELIKLTYPRFGFNDKVFRISNLNFTADCLTQVTAIEHDDNAYKIGNKRKNISIANSEGGGGEAVQILTPESPISLTATAGQEKVTLSWQNSVYANSDWRTELLRNTSDNVPTDVLQEFEIAKTSHEDTEVVAGTTYYYWVRHTKIVKTRGGYIARPKSATFPATNGRAATPTDPDIQNSADAVIWYNSTAADVASFSSSNLPANITGFPDITYSFTTVPAITGVSSGSITNDQIASTGWFRKPQPQTSGQNTFAISAKARSKTTTDTIAKADWDVSTLRIDIPTVPETEAINSSGTNLEHLFIMDSAGAVTNDFSCSFDVNKGNQAFTFASSGSADNTFGITLVSASGGLTTGEVTVSGSGVITIANTADIIDTAATLTAELKVELFNRTGGNNTDIQKHTITFSKIPVTTRDGATLTLSMTSAQATAFKGTLTDAVAQAVASAVIASSLVQKDGTAQAKRIVPNDRITVKNGAIVATRIYTGAATSNTGTVSASSFSSVVAQEFDGSVIVDGTLSADKITANTTLTNQLNVGSILKLGTSNSDANAKLFSFDKGSGITDTSAGFYMDGSGDFAVGGSGGSLIFDADAGSLVFDGTFKIGGSTVNNTYIANQAPVQSVNGATGSVSITASGLSISASDVSGLGSLATANSVSAGSVTGLGSLATASSVNALTQVTNLLGSATNQSTFNTAAGSAAPVQSVNGNVGTVSITADSLNISSANISDVDATAGMLKIDTSVTDVSAGKIILTSGNLKFTTSTNTATYRPQNSILLDTTGGNNVIEIRDGSIVRVRIGKLS